MYVAVCVRIFLRLSDWQAGRLNERASDWARESVWIWASYEAHAYWFCYEFECIYLSFACVKLLSFFLRVPILSTIRLSTFSWNFIVDRFKSCLFFSLLNIAVAAAAASIRSKRNLTKHIVPFFVARTYPHPNVIFYDVNLFIWWISVCKANKIAILNLVKFIAEKEKEAKKQTRAIFLAYPKDESKKNH